MIIPKHTRSVSAFLSLVVLAWNLAAAYPLVVCASHNGLRLEPVHEQHCCDDDHADNGEAERSLQPAPACGDCLDTDFSADHALSLRPAKVLAGRIVVAILSSSLLFKSAACRTAVVSGPDHGSVRQGLLSSVIIRI